MRKSLTKVGGQSARRVSLEQRQKRFIVGKWREAIVDFP